jgi:hypothetical protein
MFHPFRWALALAAPLLLASCFLTPGQFTSTLNIRADRSFTFTYVGEVVVSDPSSAFAQGMQEGIQEAAEGQDEDSDDADEDTEEQSAQPARPQEMTEAQRQAVIDALSREIGYRSVEYIGEGKFRVDYQISGRLDRNFVYPVNIDAMALIPWIAIELRQDGTARVTGLAFGDSAGAESGVPNAGDPNRHRNGTFTLTTDADLVMHNNEAGTRPGERTTVSWQITPTTRNAPTAVVRFAN